MRFRRKPSFFKENVLLLTTLIAYISIKYLNFCTFIPHFISENIYFRFHTELDRPLYPNIEFIRNISDRCVHCNFKPANFKPNSSPHDVVVTECRKTASGILPFVHSLRTTGSKASVVVLADTVSYNSISNFTWSFLNECGVTVINCSNKFFDLDLVKKGIFWAYDFILMNRHKLHRVIYADLFDTFFQGDPFYEGFPEDEFIVFDEGLTLRRVPIMKKWLNESKLINITDNNIGTFKYICAGNMAGSAEVLLKSLGQTLTWYEEGMQRRDQSIVNALMLQDEYKRNGIKTTPANDPNFRLVTHLIHLAPKHNEIIGNYSIYHNKNPALILHQTHYHQVVLDQILDACPEPVIENYVHYRYLKKNKPTLEAKKKELKDKKAQAKQENTKAKK